MTFKPLKSGDLIGIIATSSPAKKERFEAGCRVIEGKGFTLQVIGDPYGVYGTNAFMFASAPATERAFNLMQLYRDPAVKAVIGARGAGGVIEVLPLLDPAVFKANPKPFIGFSDSTALLLALQSWGCPVIHGPHVESFTLATTEPEVEASANDLADLLLGKRSLSSAVLEPIAHPGNFGGPLTGGNLSVLAALCGTPWQLSSSGKVLFLEEINEKPYRVHRMLVQLKMSGALDGVLGICLGAFSKCDAELGPTLDSVLKDCLAPLGVPVYRGVPAGHIKANTALPFFGTVQLSNNQLTVYLP